MVRRPLVIPLGRFSFSKHENCSVGVHALAQTTPGVVGRRISLPLPRIGRRSDRDMCSSLFYPRTPLALRCGVLLMLDVNDTRGSERVLDTSKAPVDKPPSRTACLAGEQSTLTTDDHHRASCYRTTPLVYVAFTMYGPNAHSAPTHSKLSLPPQLSGKTDSRLYVAHKRPPTSPGQYTGGRADTLERCSRLFASQPA
jgi:hypothetical protein